ncbi:MAG: hypothetical protein ACK4VZ_07440 [Paracoccaceae bacterium]
MFTNVLKKTGAVVGLMFLSAMLAVDNPSVSQIFSLAVLGVTGWAIFRPIPRIGLGNRAYSGTVLVFVGLLAFGMSLAELEKRDPVRMAELKVSNPSLYLSHLRDTDKEAWLVELETMAPDQFIAEQARAEAEAAEAQRRAAATALAEQEKAKADAAAKMDKELSFIRAKVDAFELHIARTNLASLNENGDVPEAFRAEMEAKAKVYADSLAQDGPKVALAIYGLLAVIRPENAAYQKKADDHTQQIQKQAKAAIGRMKPKLDKVEGITWLRHPNQPKYTNSRSTAFLYIGTKDGTRPWLRMQVQYAASDWLFVENVVAWVDGAKFPLISGPFERDHHSSIWEWRDVSPDAYHLTVLRSLAEGKEAILRFEGMQYKKDATLSSADKRAILETLAAYEALLAGG